MESSAAVTILDKASDGKLHNKFVIKFPADKVTVRELITRRVSQEVDTYNRDPVKKFRGLVQPRQWETDLNEDKRTKKPKISKTDQIEKALAAFEKNIMVLLINNNQVDDLDEMITIAPNTVVTFLKLVPLVGG